MKLLFTYFEFIKMFLKVRMEYKVAFFFELISNLFTVLTLYIGLWILMKNFNSFPNWNYYEVVFIYTLNIFCVAISGTILFGPMINIFTQVKDGSFDSFLIRPINPLIHLIFRNFQYSYLPWLVPVPFAMYSCFINLDINITPIKILMLLLSIIGGILINAGLLIIAGALSFWLIDSSFLVSILCTHSNSVRSFCDYPISIYSKPLQVLLTFIIPYGFINYYPSVSFFDKKDAFLFHPILPFLAPIVGIIVFVIALVIWKIGLSRYESTGT